MTMDEDKRSLNAPPSTDSPLRSLLLRHGELMDAKDLAEIFRFGSERAFRRAAQRGALPVTMVRVPGRRGWFAQTRAVAAWIESIGDDRPKDEAP